MRIAFTNSGTDDAYAKYLELAEIHGQEQDPKAAEIIVAIGGDGHMLDVLQHMVHNKVNVPVYGLNMGTVGYAMNDLGNGDLLKRIRAAEPVVIKPLQVIARNRHGHEYKFLAWNEGTVFRQTLQTLKVSVEVNGITRIRDISCDGLVYATPFGSTAYNRSAGGPVLPLESRSMALTPICPHRPRDWPGAVLPDKATVVITNLDDSLKRPMMVTADGTKIDDIRSVHLCLAARRKATLLFDKDHGLSERILREQFPF